jgi:hypothetical protein
MTEQIKPEEGLSAEQTQAMHQHEKAMLALADTQRILYDNGVHPSVIASALCASYVSFVSALLASIGMPKAMVLPSAKEAIDKMEEYASEHYDRLVESAKGLEK